MRNYGLMPLAKAGRNVVVGGPVLVRGRGQVIVGDGVVFDAHALAIELHAIPRASIFIGSSARLDGGVSIEATQCVRIGEHAHLGALVKILDNNWHGTADDRDSITESVTVVVGDGARIGERCTLLPGAHVGEGALVLPDSVVARPIPPGFVVGGVPARPQRRPE